MRGKIKIACVFFYSLVCKAGLYAQYKLHEPILVGKEQGMPTNSIRCITKGKDGFMWFGTAEGLCRFDGQQVKVYKPADIQNPVGATDVVNAILTIDDEIWMGTNQGVSILNKTNETFRHFFFRNDNELDKADSLQNFFYEPVPVLYQDRQGEIWAGTRNKGVWKYDKEERTFKRIRYPETAYPKITPTLASEGTILSLEQSITNDSIIWAGTTAGLEEINKYNGEVRWYTFPKKEKDYQVALNAFRRLYQHDDGLLYVGSWAAGVNVFDPVKKTFVPLQVNNEAGRRGLGNNAGNILRKSENELWITTSLGLSIYNTERKEISWYWLNHIPTGQVFGIDYIDESNRVWQITIKGVQYFDITTQQFSHYSFEHLFDKGWAFAFYIKSDTTGNQITVCPRVADGLYRYDKNKFAWTRLPFHGLANLGYENLIVRGFEEVTRDNYLISTDNGLYSYSVKDGKFSPAPHPPKISFNRWGDMLKASDGELWISADADGLIKWNLASGKYRIYKKELNANNDEIDFVRTDNLFEDSRHNIWFSREGGFSVYLAGRDTILNFLHRKDPGNSFPAISDFAEDRSGKLWVVSQNGWYGYIDISDPAKGIRRKFNLKEKDIDGYFSRLATDKEGNVWSYTKKLLVRINTADLSLSRFSFEYGVQDPDFFHFSFLPNGEMVFGGRNSITLANIGELKRNTELPVPYISQLNILNRSVNPSLYSKELDLRYNQNFITIFFSARAYTMAKGVRFRYRLKDFDDWTEVEGSQFANYTNIPPGDYVFQLQAANNEGMWNEKMLERPVHIATPWWLTWWFRIGFLLLVAGLVYWLYRYRIGQVKKKEKLKTQYEKKLANVEMTALLAQMNPHFLFNCLNSIDSYIIKNESGKASEYLNNFARLMRLILQNSRSNYISLKDELETLALYLQMEQLRFSNKFEYEIKTDDSIDMCSIVIPPMLIQPYVENAIWHGLMHKKDGIIGKVEIAISTRENNLVCVISDNGIGRERAAEIKAQKPGNHKRSMGMQITSDRMEMINKLYDTNTSVQIMDIRDKEGKSSGTKVKLVIPF